MLFFCNGFTAILILNSNQLLQGKKKQPVKLAMKAKPKPHDILYRLLRNLVQVKPKESLALLLLEPQCNPYCACNCLIDT